MNEVSCRVFGFPLDALAARGIPLEELVRGLPVTLEHLRDAAERVDWDVFAMVCERFGELVGGAAALEEIGRVHAANSRFEFVAKIAAAVTSPRDLYWMGTVWFGRSLFTIVESEYFDLPDGRIREVLFIPPPYRDCPDLFHIIGGFLAGAPVLLRLDCESAEVESVIEPRRAVYTIRPPGGEGSFLHKIYRLARASIGVRRLIGELSEQQTMLQQSYRDLAVANQRIATQASMLTRINQIGQELSKHIELERFARGLAEQLELQFPECGIAVWVRPLDGDKELLLRKSGPTLGPPAHSHLLRTADRPVGRLEIWETGARLSGDRRDLLAELLPWIAVALDNARSYTALGQNNERLEARVHERTAKLEAANRQLVEEVAERERAAKALSESQEQLRTVERLASVGTLAAGIAHEINNPVASILAAAQYALAWGEDQRLPGVASQALKDIVQEARRCGVIVKSVLQFSRDEPTEKWVADVNDVVNRAVCATGSYAAEHGKRIELNLCEGPCLTVMNPIEVEQVVVNLLRNAIETEMEVPRIDIATECREDTVCITVRDRGSGMDAEVAGRVFDPFFTTRRRTGGTGLGLSVAHGIIRSHGGWLRLRNHETGGVLGEIDLPRAPEASAADPDS